MQSSNINPMPDWTKQEVWVWKRICTGEVANFNLSKDYGGELLPQDREQWTNSRKIRSIFLETVLLSEPYKSAIASTGIRIVGAWFEDPLNLSYSYLGCHLWLNNSIFESRVSLAHIETRYLLSLAGSHFNSIVDMNNINIGRDLLMDNSAKFKEVNLEHAKINGKLDFSSATVTGLLNIGSLKLNGSLFMDKKARFAFVNIGSAEIGDQLVMSTSQFGEYLNMNGIQINGNLFMRQRAKFDEVNLQCSQISRQIDMSDSVFKGKLDLSSLQVEGSLILANCKATGGATVDLHTAIIRGHINLTGAEFSNGLDMSGVQVERDLVLGGNSKFTDVDIHSASIGGDISIENSRINGILNLNGARIKGSLYLRKSSITSTIYMVSGSIGGIMDSTSAYLSNYDLTSTHIAGEFRLGSEMHSATKWQAESVLTLRNTEVDSIQDLPYAWPDKLELDGFKYGHLGGIGASNTADFASRKISWLKNWLKKQKRYSPQPYEQLASVLRKAGYIKRAITILYEGKRREHKETTDVRSRIWWVMTLQRAFIGYGYNNFRVLYWVIIFCGLGMLALHVSGQDTLNSMKYFGLAYSLDMLLPVIELYKPHYSINLDGWVRVYFYFHKILGYVLASFLISGLAGLTKR